MTDHSVETVIVGGGIAGISLAYFLAAAGADSVTVVDAGEIGAGCTAWSLGGVRQQFSHPAEVELAVRGRNFWREFEARFDYPCTYHQDGYLLVTGRDEVWANLHAAADVQRSVGATDVELLPADRLTDVAPWVSPQGLLGGCWTPLDGRMNPTDGLQGMARAARSLGVSIVEHTPVTGIARSGSSWQVVAGGTWQAQRVVVAAGLAAPALTAPFGLSLDITPLWLHCGYTTSVAVGQAMPLMIDLDTGLIIEREGEGACVTVSDTSFGPGGATRAMEAFAEHAAVRAPAFGDVGIRTTSSAAFDATGGDGHAYVGEVEDGLWVLAGFDGHGTMQGPELARLLSRMMAGDHADDVIDVRMFDPWRAGASAGEWLRAAKA